MNYQNCEGMVYSAQKGDTLYSLSRRYNTPLALILRANPYVDVYNLQVGDEICIPVNAGNPDMPAAPGPGPMPLPTPSLPNYPAAPEPGPLPLPTPSLPAPGPLPTPVIPVGSVVAYVIRDRDTISDVLDRFGINLDDFFYYNNLNGVMLRPGMTINIPMYPSGNK